MATGTIGPAGLLLEYIRYLIWFATMKKDLHHSHWDDFIEICVRSQRLCKLYSASTDSNQPNNHGGKKYDNDSNIVCSGRRMSKKRNQILKETNQVFTFPLLSNYTQNCMSVEYGIQQNNLQTSYCVHKIQVHTQVTTPLNSMVRIPSTANKSRASYWTLSYWASRAESARPPRSLTEINVISSE